MGKGSGSCGDRPGLAMSGDSASSPASTSSSLQGQLFKIGTAVTEAAVNLLTSGDGDTSSKQSSNDDKYDPGMLSKRELEQDERSRLAGKKGTFKVDDTKYKLNRPHAGCIECGYAFLDNDAFHWTDDGPVHGWGSYGTKKVCGFAKKEHGKAASKNSKPKKEEEKNYLRCTDCGEIIYQNQAYHYIEGGAVHGKGSRGDVGTCLIAHRTNLTDALQTLAEDFYDGKISPEQMLEYMKETHEVETDVAKRVAQATKNSKEEAKKSSSSKSSSKSSSSSSSSKSSSVTSSVASAAQTEAADIADALDEMLEVIHEADSGITMDQFRENHADAYNKWLNVYEQYDGSATVEEAYDMMQERLLQAEDAAFNGSSLPPQLSPTDPCHCGSGAPYEDCHEDEDEKIRFEAEALAQERAAADAGIPSIYDELNADSFEPTDEMIEAERASYRDI